MPLQAHAPHRQSLKSIPQLPTIPYGVEMSGGTDFAKLGSSLRQQLVDAGLPAPQILKLHPDEHWHDPLNPTVKWGEIDLSDIAAEANGFALGHTTKHAIIGNKLSHPAASLQENIKALQSLAELSMHEKGNVPGRPSSDMAFPMTDNQLDTFIALHECAHYVTYNMNLDGKVAKGNLDTNDEVFDNINQISSQSIPSYGNSLKKGLQNATSGEEKAALQDKLTVARGVASYVPDRIADASASLYMLSNTNNPERTEAFLKHWEAFRNTTFTDLAHDTSSSIEAAIEEFKQNPRKNMSIVETTKLAAQIVSSQSDLQLSTAEMAHEMNLQSLVAKGTHKYLQDTISAAIAGKPKNKNETPYTAAAALGHDLSTDDKQKIKGIFDKADKAANSLLHAKLPAP